MATPTLSHHHLPGALGEILVDVRAGSRDRPQPAVLLIHGFKGFKDYAFLPILAEQLARAVICWSAAPTATSLDHNAAEAILIGLWGTVAVGWLAALPTAVRLVSF